MFVSHNDLITLNSIWEFGYIHRVRYIIEGHIHNFVINMIYRDYSDWTWFITHKYMISVSELKYAMNCFTTANTTPSKQIKNHMTLQAICKK